MGDWPPTSGGRVQAAGATTANSGGTSITGSGTNNTKGSWIELIAATDSMSAGLILTANIPAASHLLDIGIGAAGSETVLVPDILLAMTLANMTTQVMFPVTVPAGARISARVAATAGAAAPTITVYLVGGGFDASVGRSAVTAYGATAADSGGVSVDPGGTANTKGSWTEIVASTTASMKVLIIGTGNQANLAATAASWLADIGVGGAGSEQIIVPNYRLVASVNETLGPLFSPVIPVSIPQGSRLAVRSQCTTTDATDRLIDFILYGIT